MDKLKMQTENIVDENIDFIGKKFPNCIVEAKDESGKLTKMVDFDLLKQELSKVVVDGDKERYTMNWPDKKKAILTANSPVAMTLRPCKEKSVDFDNTKNIYIEGDNLDVLKVLRETYLGKIKMIYIDPPYNTGSDFVYHDNFNKDLASFEDQTDYRNENGEIMWNEAFKQNASSNGRFHTDWLNMMYPRLRIAKDFLADDGVIFISINDYEQNNLLKICFELFGEQNFIANLVWTNNEGGGSSDSKFFKVKHEYILCFAKNADMVPGIVNVDIEDIDRYKLSDKYESTRGKYQLVKLASASLQYSESLDYAITCPDGTQVFPKDNTDKDKAIWRWSKQKLQWGIDNDFVVMKKDKDDKWQIYTKQYVNCDKDGNIVPRSKKPLGFIDKHSSTQGSNELFKILGTKTFSYPKPTDLIKYLLERFSFKKDEIILDFFSGSATTAQAVLELNAEDGGKRKFIMVQLPEICDANSDAYKSGYKVICEIGEERIRRIGKKLKQDIEASNTFFDKNENKDKQSEEFKNAASAIMENLKNDDLGAIYVDEKQVPDIGFRVFKLDTSNMKETYYKPSDYTANLLDQLDENIKPDRTPEDLLFQVMLDLGLMLDSKIEEKNINSKKVFVVGEYNDYVSPDLICCFDNDVDNDTVTEIAKLKPRFSVFRDSSMARDSVAVNFDQIFETYSPSTTRKVL